MKYKKREVKQIMNKKSSATWQLVKHWNVLWMNWYEFPHYSQQVQLLMNIHVPFPLCSLWVGMLTEPVVHLSPLSSSGSGAAHAEPPFLPPQWSRSRAALHCCVRPAGASPRTGRLAGRWGAAACLGGCQIVWGSWGKMDATAGAAPWPSPQTGGGRRAQWSVRPVRVARRLWLKPWILTSVESREAPAWKYCRIHVSSDTSALYFSV